MKKGKETLYKLSELEKLNEEENVILNEIVNETV